MLGHSSAMSSVSVQFVKTIRLQNSLAASSMSALLWIIKTEPSCLRNPQSDFWSCHNGLKLEFFDLPPSTVSRGFSCPPVTYVNSPEQTRQSHAKELQPMKVRCAMCPAGPACPNLIYPGAKLLWHRGPKGTDATPIQMPPWPLKGTEGTSKSQ